MRVASKLVDLEFHISRIEAAKDGAKNGIVILNDPTKSMATKVYIDPADAMAIAKVVLTSSAALRFMFIFPFSYMFGKSKKPKSAGSR